MRQLLPLLDDLEQLLVLLKGFPCIPGFTAGNQVAPVLSAGLFCVRQNRAALIVMNDRCCSKESKLGGDTRQIREGSRVAGEE